MLLEVLLPLGLLIVVGKLLEGVLARFGLSSILAYTVTGLLLGPVLGVVHPTGEIELFLSIGIFVLFFLIGLDEIDLPGFIATIRGRYFVAAVLSVAISLVAALTVTSDLLGVDFALGLEFTEALALAGILSLSSLGLAAKVLADGGHLKEPIGLKVFTVVIIAEVAALLVVGFTIGEHYEFSLIRIPILLGQIAAFVIVTWLLSTRVLPPAILFMQRLLNVPELSFGLMIGGLFLMVVGAEMIGLHGTIGALVFGISLSGMPLRVRQEILPGMRSASEGLFVPLFFASAGLHFDLSFTALPGATIAALVLIPLVGKFAGSLLSTYVTRLDTPLTLATGLMSKGVAEIALLLVLLQNGAIERNVFSLFVLIMFGYILLMPPVIDFAVRRAKTPAGAAPQPEVSPAYARYALAGVKVSSLLDRTREYPGPQTSVREFMERWLVPEQRDYLVVDAGAVTGMASLARLRSLHRGAWADTPLSRVLRRNLPHAFPDELIADVLERMANHSVRVIPVRDRESGAFAGSLASHDVLDLVLLAREIKEEEEARLQREGGAAG